MDDKFKWFLGGILLSTGIWMWVVNLREHLLSVFPNVNQYVLATILVLVGGYLTRK